MNGQVDVLALTKEEKVVAAGLVALADLYGSAPRDSFFWKATTTIAYRLFALGAVDEGMSVLTMVPAEYFAGPALEQMETDPLYAELARCLCDKLLVAGKVAPPTFDYDPSKVPAQRTFGKA